MEKLNKVDGNIYVIEEEAHLTDGVYEAALEHDNINPATLAVFTGPKLTGERIQSYALSTPSLTPWKRVIRVYADVPVVFISYETDGDMVEAEDINQVQEDIVRTQEELNAETERAICEEARLDGAVESERDRAMMTEKLLADDLAAESVRAKGAEKSLTDSLAAEAARAKGAEKELTDNVGSEAARAKAAEKTNADNISSEHTRALTKEAELQGNIDAHVSTVEGELQALKAADTALDEKKANTVEVNQELGNRYTKDQVFTKQEVLQKIENLIGSAPDTLDTFKEIADALGNNPDFAATIMNELSEKVDKVSGKQLSSNDYSDSEKAIVADANAKKHTHSNKSVLDKITQTLLDNWNVAYTHVSDSVKHITSAERMSWNDADSKKHTHGNKTVLDKLTQVMLDKLAGIAEGANKYVHPTTSGNKHIPTGGANGQFLKWSADGTAVWAVDNNTTYTAFRAATASAAGGAGLVPAPAAGAQAKYLKGDGTWATPEGIAYIHPSSGVVAGTYRSVTVNAQGHVTAGTNPTTLAGYGITDAAAKSHNHDSSYLKKGAMTWADLRGGG